jgi:hypothetical protein
MKNEIKTGSINDLKKLHKKLKPKSHFFSTGAMDFFSSRLHKTTFSRPEKNLIYFISSEQYSPEKMIDAFEPKSLKEIAHPIGAMGAVVSGIIKKDNPNLKNGPRFYTIRSMNTLTGQIETITPFNSVHSFKTINEAIKGVKDLFSIK